MKKKRILIYSLDFMPDHSGISIYSSDFAKYCCENDFQVEVITGFPFYPNYKKLDKDKGKLFRKDNINGITVRRGYLYVPEDPIPRKRIIHEISFLIFAFINSFLVKKPDFVVVFTTPVLLGVLAAFFNKFWKAKLIINVQDFQIEAAESLGMLKKSFMLKILESAEKWSYKNSDIVTSISQGMVELLQKKKEIEKKRTFLWPNWIHTSLDNLSLTKEQFFIRDKLYFFEKVL